MSGFPFTISVTPPGSLKLKPGEKAAFSFTLTNLAAPDRTFDLRLLPLVFNEEGKGKEVDWLDAVPEQLSMKGGKTETVTITAAPTATSAKGEHTVKLRVAKNDEPNEHYVDSAPVTCEVLAPERETRPTGRPGWLIPVIVAGAVVVVAGGGLLVWKLLQKEHGLGDPCDAQSRCDDDLLCTGAQRCLLAGGSRCDGAQATLCASGECKSTSVCAIPIGGSCASNETLCSELALCDSVTSKCVSKACTPGAVQCTADGSGINTCENNSWKSTLCPKSSPQCRDAKCQCLPAPDKTCAQCEDTVQCEGFGFRRGLSAWEQPETGWASYTLHVADVNGDRRADLIWNLLSTNNRTFVALSNGDGTFKRALTNWTQAELGWSTYKLHLADVNGDGRADLIWNELGDGNRTYVALANEDGTFKRALTAWDQPERGWRAYTLHVADLDDNGRADLIWNERATGNRTYVALSNGDGTFRRALTAWDQPETGWAAYILHVADVNHDRRADLIWNELGQLNRTYVALSNGDGTFRRALTAWDQPESGWTGALLHVADVNDDQNADLVWNQLGDGNRTHTALSNGDGTFRRALTAWDQPEAGWTGATLHVVDVNADRRADLVWNQLGDGNRTHIALSNGDGTFRRVLTAWDQAERGWPAYKLYFADVSQDGRPELIWNALTDRNRTTLVLSHGAP
jgi:hypothetical protein